MAIENKRPPYFLSHTAVSASKKGALKAYLYAIKRDYPRAVKDGCWKLYLALAHIETLRRLAPDKFRPRNPKLPYDDPAKGYEEAMEKTPLIENIAKAHAKAIAAVRKYQARYTEIDDTPLPPQCDHNEILIETITTSAHSITVNGKCLKCGMPLRYSRPDLPREWVFKNQIHGFRFTKTPDRL